jgi:hypothetical protein
MLEIDLIKFKRLMMLLEGIIISYAELKDDGLLYTLWNENSLVGMEPPIGTVIKSEHGNFEVLRLERKVYNSVLLGITVVMRRDS